MELEKIKNIISKKSKEYNMSIQLLWDNFFFERFLNRLSKSKYSNYFLFKGGFLLQSIVGIMNRTTLDIDLKILANHINDDELIKIFNEVCDNNIDNISFNVLGINDIKAETRYGGKTIKIEAKFYNIKKIFSIDVGAGDVVTPYPINYCYHSNILDDDFNIMSYPLETIVAEKFETLISKGTNNSRSKDLFDLYLITKQSLNYLIVNSAMINTFNIRNTNYSYDFISKTLNDIFISETIKKLYENYANKKTFVKNVSFDDCKAAVYEIFNKLEFKDKINLNDYAIELHIVRHGQDEKNKLGGWSDNHLTDEGINQINNLKDEIDDNYDLFISSDLTRCVETSNIINEKLNMDIIYDSNYREVNNGDLKNLTLEEFNNKYPGLYFSSLDMDEKYPNGESPNDFYNRVSKAFIDLLENNRGKKILLVTHGGVITVLLCLIKGYKYSNYLKIVPNTGTITKLK